MRIAAASSTASGSSSTTRNLSPRARPGPLASQSTADPIPALHQRPARLPTAPS